MAGPYVALGIVFFGSGDSERNRLAQHLDGFVGRVQSLGGVSVDASFCSCPNSVHCAPSNRKRQIAARLAWATFILAYGGATCGRNASQTLLYGIGISQRLCKGLFACQVTPIRINA